MITDADIMQEAIRLVDEGVSVTLPVNGWSMLPFIVGGRESVILGRPDGAKVGDVVLAWLPRLSPAGSSPQAVGQSGRYVVHRIIRIEGDRVTLMGDGNLAGTEYCTVSDIKARATHVVGADGRTHYLYNRWRRIAARLWFWLRPARRYLLAIYRRLCN